MFVLMWQSVYLFWKRVVWDIGCVFTYFYGEFKTNFRLIFCSVLKALFLKYFCSFTVSKLMERLAVAKYFCSCVSEYFFFPALNVIIRQQCWDLVKELSVFNHFDSFCYILEQFRARVLLHLPKMIRVIFQVMSPNLLFLSLIKVSKKIVLNLMKIVILLHFPPSLGSLWCGFCWIWLGSVVIRFFFFHDQD